LKSGLHHKKHGGTVQMAPPAPIELPDQVTRSIEWQQRMLGGRSGNPLLLYEKPRRAVVVVDVARAWAGKPQRIMSIAPK
jgi:hypothetical protein